MHELATNAPSATPLSGVRLIVRGSERTYTHWLLEGESALIGSHEQCRIRIIDPTVSDRQCLVQLRAGEIYVHDWGSKHPTMTNGEPANSSIALSLKDRIGFAEFTLVFDNEQDAKVPPAELPRAVAQADCFDHEGNEPNLANPSLCSRTDESQDESWGEINTDEEQRIEPLAEISVESSTMEILTSELELLQAELSEKNAIIEEYTKGKQNLSSDGASSPNELERRIELLLFELEQSDHRVSAMEDAMRLSEEAHDAEIEEKRQLEAWFNDIEERLAARELEIAAEYEALRRRLERATHARKQAEGRVTSLIDDGGRDNALQGMVQVLRHENEQLRNKSEQQSLRVSTLDKELEGFRRNSTEEAIQRRIADALRSERLELAKERAAISRQQLDMNAKINELRHQIENRARFNPADEKFRAFRDQLKELHEQEKREYVPPTLTQRLTNVWRKLDGPTDTD